MCFGAIQNNVKSNRIELNYVIISLVKSKPSEIYRRMCDAYTEAYFNFFLMLTNRQNVGLPPRA